MTGGGRRGRPGGTPGAHKLTLTCLRPFKCAFSPKSSCDAGVTGKEHLGPSVRGLCGWLPCQGPPCPRQRLLPTRRQETQVDQGRSGLSCTSQGTCVRRGQDSPGGDRTHPGTDLSGGRMFPKHLHLPQRKTKITRLCVDYAPFLFVCFVGLCVSLRGRLRSLCKAATECQAALSADRLRETQSRAAPHLSPRGPEAPTGSWPTPGGSSFQTVQGKVLGPDLGAHPSLIP